MTAFNMFHFLNLLYDMNVTVLLQGATPLPSQEDSAELVSKILTIKLWRCKKDPRSVFNDLFSVIIFNCLYLLYNIKITVLLQGATALPSQEDRGTGVSKIITIKLWRCRNYKPTCGHNHLPAGI